jgi:hypothetical protein
MEKADQVQFEIAEVLAYSDTYKYVGPDSPNTTASNLFSIQARGCSSYYNHNILTAKPANINMKRIPLIGEYVLLVKTFNQEATSEKWRHSWYYLSTVDIQSSINDNTIPGLSIQLTQEQIDSTLPGKTFQPKVISPLQPFEGDVLMEGRWGNSIRFGSTVDLSDAYSIDRPWEGKQNGDPITIIANGQKNYPNKQFTVENIETDDASLYLTSTQSIPNIGLNNILKIGVSDSAFNKSQFIGTADRVILKAKTDVVVLDSQKGIELLSPKVNIGAGPYEPILQGPAVQQLLEKIVEVIQAGFVDSSGAISTPINNALSGIDLSRLLSKTIQIDQYKEDLIA